MSETETHWSRSFDGPGHLEFRCPCPKAPCGMVVRGVYSDLCLQHPIERMKTTRDGHPADKCPGVGHQLTSMRDYISWLEEERASLEDDVYDLENRLQQYEEI